MTDSDRPGTAEWPLWRLKDLTRINPESLPEDTRPDRAFRYVDISGVDGLGRITGFEDTTFEKAPSRARRLAAPGDVVLSTVRTYLRAIAKAPPESAQFVFSTGFAVLRPSREVVDGEFLWWALQAESYVQWIVAHSEGIGYPSIGPGELGSLRLRLPSLVQQRAIAAFLDRETARIDALIAKKERILELLEEKRSALITRAVTKGLDPVAPMKDSGVEGLGEVPAHWEVVRVKSITASHKQGFYTEQPYVDGGVKLARITDITDRAIVSFEDMPFVAVPEATEHEFAIREGDFLFARSGTIGRFGVVRQPERAVFASYLIRFTFGGIDREFLRYAFHSRPFQESLISSLHGGANQNVHAENIKDRWIPKPPLPEQRSIAVFLERETQRISTLVQKVRDAIPLLREYRTALISAAGTGQVDVSDLKAAGKPETQPSP